MTADPATDSNADPAAHLEAPAARRRRLRLLGLLAAIVLLLDAGSKAIAQAHLADRDPVVLIPRVLDLQLTYNTGAAFSLGGGATLLLTLVAVGVVVAIVRTAPRLASTGWAAVLGLLLGGALGNLADRMFRAPAPGRGAVVDWIHLAHWPIFNLADTAIVTGGALAVLLSARGVRATAVRP